MMNQAASAAANAACLGTATVRCLLPECINAAYYADSQARRCMVTLEINTHNPPRITATVFCPFVAT